MPVSYKPVHLDRYRSYVAQRTILELVALYFILVAGISAILSSLVIPDIIGDDVSNLWLVAFWSIFTHLNGVDSLHDRLSQHPDLWRVTSPALIVVLATLRLVLPTLLLGTVAFKMITGKAILVWRPTLLLARDTHGRLGLQVACYSATRAVIYDLSFRAIVRVLDKNRDYPLKNIKLDTTWSLAVPLNHVPTKALTIPVAIIPDSIRDQGQRVPSFCVAGMDWEIALTKSRFRHPRSRSIGRRLLSFFNYLAKGSGNAHGAESVACLEPYEVRGVRVAHAPYCELVVIATGDVPQLGSSFTESYKFALTAVRRKVRVFGLALWEWSTPPATRDAYADYINVGEFDSTRDTMQILDWRQFWKEVPIRQHVQDSILRTAAWNSDTVSRTRPFLEDLLREASEATSRAASSRPVSYSVSKPADGMMPLRSTAASEEAEVADGISIERFVLELGEHHALPVVQLTPKRTDVSERMPAAICLHQTTTDQRVGKLETVGLGGDLQYAYALELAKQGFVTLSPDYPGFGDYDCETISAYSACSTEAEIAAVEHKFAFSLEKARSLGFDSLTGLALWNHVRAVDYLVALDYVDQSSVVVIGHSLGGHNALFLAAFDSRIKAVVCSAGFTVFAKYCLAKAQAPRDASVLGERKSDHAIPLEMGGVGQHLRKSSQNRAVRDGNPGPYCSMATWGDDKYMPRVRRAYSDNWQQMPWDLSEVAAALAPTPLFLSAPGRDRLFGADAWKAASCLLESAYRDRTWLEVDVPDCGHEFPRETRDKAYEFIFRALSEFCPRTETE
jgi:pimeloyl-ACP methyl ester carboxylesterase